MKFRQVRWLDKASWLDIRAARVLFIFLCVGALMLGSCTDEEAPATLENDPGLAESSVLQLGTGEFIFPETEVRLGPTGLGGIRFVGEEALRGMFVFPMGEVASVDINDPTAYPVADVTMGVGANLVNAFAEEESDVLYHVYLAYSVLGLEEMEVIYFRVYYDAQAPDIAAACAQILPEATDRFVSIDEETTAATGSFSWRVITALDVDTAMGETVSTGELVRVGNGGLAEETIELSSPNGNGVVTMDLGVGEYILRYEARDLYENVALCEKTLAVRDFLLTLGSGKPIFPGDEVALGPVGLRRVSFVGAERLNGFFIFRDGAEPPASVDINRPNTYPSRQTIGNIGDNLFVAFSNEAGANGGLYHVYVAYNYSTIDPRRSTYFQVRYDDEAPELAIACERILPSDEDRLQLIATETSGATGEFSWQAITSLDIDAAAGDVVSMSQLVRAGNEDLAEEITDLPLPNDESIVTVNLVEGVYTLRYEVQDVYENAALCEKILVVGAAFLYQRDADGVGLDSLESITEGKQFIISADRDLSTAFIEAPSVSVTAFAVIPQPGESPTLTEGVFSDLLAEIGTFDNHRLAVTLEFMVEDISSQLEFEVIRDGRIPQYRVSDCGGAMNVRIPEDEDDVLATWTLPMLEDTLPSGLLAGVDYATEQRVTLHSQEATGVDVLIADFVDPTVFSRRFVSGVYELTYMAEDAVGNISDACRLTIRVFPSSGFLLYDNEQILNGDRFYFSNAAMSALAGLFTEVPGVSVSGYEIATTVQSVPSYRSGNLSELLMGIVTMVADTGNHFFYVYVEADMGRTLSFSVAVDETLPTFMGCEDTIRATIPLGTRSIDISWTSPTIHDVVPTGFPGGETYPAPRMTGSNLMRFDGEAPLSPNGEVLAITDDGSSSSVEFADQGTYTVNYEGVDTAGNVGSCSFDIMIDDENKIEFEFPNLGGGEIIVSAMRDEEGLDSYSGPGTTNIGSTDDSDSYFSCGDVNRAWGSGFVTCLGNPRVDFTSYAPDAEDGISLYEKVEIRITHREVTGKTSADTDVLAAIVATDIVQTGEVRELRRTNSSLEILRYTTLTGSDTNTAASQRTLREDITHLWPYFQGKMIYLSMNHRIASHIVLEEVEFILTPYSEAPAQGTLLPYRVAPSWGNGLTPNAEKDPDNSFGGTRFLSHTPVFGADSDSYILSNVNFKTIDAPIGKRDISELDELRAYVYSTGHNRLEGAQYNQEVWIDTDTNIAGALSLGEIEIDSSAIIEAIDNTSDYHRLLPRNENAQRIQETARRSGWLPGRRTPYHEVSTSRSGIDAHSGSGFDFSEGSSLYVNLNFPESERSGEISFSSTSRVHFISASMVLFTRYVP